jgi:8-oxo-dGTP pyrophosphatase MutT (NUDIX family)
VVREIDEETTVKVTPTKFLYHINWDSGQEHFFYLCDYVSGEPQLREDSNEYKRNKSGEQVYEPLWIEIEKLSNLQLYQLEIRDLFLEDYKKGFADTTKELHLK